MTEYGGRRFLLVIGCALTYTALLVGGYLDSGAFVALHGGGQNVPRTAFVVSAYESRNGLYEWKPVYESG